MKRGGIMEKILEEKLDVKSLEKLRKINNPYVEAFIAQYAEICAPKVYLYQMEQIQILNLLESRRLLMVRKFLLR